MQDFTKSQSNFLKGNNPIEMKKEIVNQQWLTKKTIEPLDFSCKRKKTPYTRWMDKKFKNELIFKG